MDESVRLNVEEVESESDMLNSVETVVDGLLDTVELRLWLKEAVEETLLDAITVPLVVSDSLRLTEDVMLKLVLNESEAVDDAVMDTLVVAEIEALMLVLDVTLDEALGDREVVQLTELVEDGECVALWLTDGVLVELNEGETV